MLPAVSLLGRAKLNLSLDVGLCRPDGYHEVNTVMTTLELADTVTVRVLKSSPATSEVEGDLPIKVRCRGPGGVPVAGIPEGRSNLAYRAMETLWRKWGPLRVAGLEVEIIKAIPAAAGLGGGSADAAAALWGANLLLNLGLPPGLLAEVGAGVGSDVPFAVVGGTAWGRGRGEQLTLLPSPPHLWIVICKPGQGLATADCYQQFDRSGNRGDVSGRRSTAVAEALERKELPTLLFSLGNDLEEAAFEICPEAARIKNNLLSCGARAAHLCGSGSAVYGVWLQVEAAREAAVELARHYGDIWLTSIL